MFIYFYLKRALYKTHDIYIYYVCIYSVIVFLVICNMLTITHIVAHLKHIYTNNI